MKNCNRSYYLFFIAISLALLSCSYDKGFIPFGQPDIDRVRKEVVVTPTDSVNFDERINTVSLWLRFVMFSGADMAVDWEKHKGHLSLKGSEYTPEMAAEVDYLFNVLEEIWIDFSKDTNKYLVKMNRDPSDNNGEVHNWYSLRGNPQLTAATTDPGPMKGELHWKFPTPHLWLTRPAFDKGRVYIGSPGVSYLAYCIDTKTGEYIWKTTPKGNGIRIRYYGPRASSPVLIAGDDIIFRRIQVGTQEHFIKINKETGVQQKGIINHGHLNSSSGYAPFDGNEKYLVYPQGIMSVRPGENQSYADQLAHRKVREDFPFDSLACKSTSTGELVWKKYMGEFYAEPLLNENQVFCGNTAGDFRCYNVINGDLLWEVKTGASINAKAAANDQLVLIGNEAGKIFAFNKKTGEEVWSSQLQTVPTAFQVFSSFTIAGENAYLGSADKNVYCFETKTGKQKWKLATDDWVRSAPLVMVDHLYVATLGGKIFCIETKEDKPVIKWEKVVSEFQILADLTVYEGDIFFTTGDFYLVSVEPNSGTINWKTSTFERITDKEGNIIIGDKTGQPDEQSSVIAVDGKAYFGMPGFVYCVDIETGKRIWRFEERGQFTGAPYISNGKLFIGQRGGTPNFYCLDAATGEVIWKKRFGHVWASANGLLDGKVYLNSEGGAFYCVDENTGDIIWQYKAELGTSYNTPSFYQNLVYLASNHTYYAFEKNTGELKWKYNLGTGKPDSGNPLIEDGIMYCGSRFKGEYAAIDALTGEEIWLMKNLGTNTSPTTDGTNIIVNQGASYGGTVFTPNTSGTVCLDMKTREIKYRYPFGGWSAPALGNNLVFMGAIYDPYFRAWDIKTGEMRWVYRMGGSTEESCVTIYGDKAFILARDSYTYCFR